MARTTQPAPSRSGRSAPSAPARPIVRDFTGSVGRAAVTFEPRTVYDFVVSMNVLAGDEADLLPEDAAWLERSRASLPDGVRTDLLSCFGDESMGAFHALPSVVVSRPDATRAADLVRVIEELGPTELARLFLRDVLKAADAADLAERILAGDEEALSTAQDRFDELEKGSIVAFLREPTASVERMRAVIEAWLPLYQEVEPRVEQMLERDVVARRRDVTSLDQDALIEKTTGGLRWLPEPQIKRVIMAPSYFARPYNYIYQGQDWRMFCYPIADGVVGAAPTGLPPQATVRLYRALGDATRMRTLKLLSDRDWYLTELAQQLELSKPTMKHHLALLRAAGLVTVTEEGSLTYYSLRRERLEEAGAELRAFLG